MNKKGISGKGFFGILVVVIMNLIFAIIIIESMVVIVPEAQSAGDQLNQSNRCADVGCLFNSTTDLCQVGPDDSSGCGVNTTVPLASLLGSNGVVFIVIMAAIFFAVLFIFMATRPDKK